MPFIESPPSVTLEATNVLTNVVYQIVPITEAFPYPFGDLTHLQQCIGVLKDLHALMTTPAVAKEIRIQYLPEGAAYEWRDLIPWLSVLIQAWETKTGFSYVICREGKVHGFITLSRILPGFEVLGFLDEESRGIMAPALQLVLSTFRELNPRIPIFASVQLDNHRSIRLAQRCGFTLNPIDQDPRHPLTLEFSIRPTFP